MDEPAASGFIERRRAPRPTRGRGISLFQRLLAALLVVGVVTAAPVFWVSFDYSQRQALARMEKDLAQQISMIGAGFEQEYRVATQRSLKQIASSEVLAGVLASGREERMVNAKLLEAAFANIAREHAAYSGLYFLNDAGQELAAVVDRQRAGNPAAPASWLRPPEDTKPTATMAAGRRLFERISTTPALLSSGNMEWFMPPRDILVEGPFVDERDRQSLLMGIAILDPDNGAFSGVAMLRVSLQTFLERLQDVKVFDENVIWLFARDGSALLTPEKAAASFNPVPAFSAEAAGDPETVHATDGLVTYLDIGLPEARALLRLSYAVPYSLLAKDFAATRQVFLIVMLLSAGAVLVLAYVVSRTISRPVAKLADAAARLARGDLSARVDASTGGELQVLVNSFNRMSDNLRQAHDARSAAMDLLRRTASLLRTEPATADGAESDMDAVEEDERDLRRVSELIRDLITERERHLAQLKASADAAEAANRAKSDFLANMSHEIRTPMNGIIGMADLALDADADAERVEYMRIVKSSAESLLGIINDILDFSKIEAGKLQVERVPYGLTPAVQGVLDTLGVRAREKGLQLRTEFAADVPAAVVGDPTRLRQVLLNLVGNAIKFTERGNITVAVSVSERSATTARLDFAVRDTGIGIPADKLESIFEAFSQADTSTTRKYGGTGLGLSITSHLVELMGGMLEVDSRPGEGSTFHFSLPLGLADEGVLHAAADEATGKGDRPAGSLDVLLVEDNPVNQQLAIRLLEKWGHHIVLAVNGREAVDMVTAGARFDLVLMDMQMPVLGGIAATREIRAFEADTGAPRLRIVAMTANAMQSDRDACLAAGMDDYLAKPIQKDELAARLRMAGPSPAESDATIYAGTAELMLEDFDYAAALARQDGEIIEILAPAFLQHAQGELDALAGALAVGDAAEVMRLAHGLKGSLAAFGARPAERLADDMEQRARRGELDGMPSLLHQLGSATAALKRVLAALPAQA